MVVDFQKFEEIKTDLKSFKIPERPPLIKDELHPEIWKDPEMLEEEVRDRLLAIANDFYASLELDIEYEDIWLIGSLVNYNWHDNSDFDLHILLDTKKLDGDEELLAKYFKLQKKRWNNTHNITIYGFEVEVSVQDIDAEFKSNGVFSVKDNKWLKKPKRLEISVEAELNAREKFYDLAEMVDDLSSKLYSGKVELYELYHDLNILWKKVKKLRKSKDFKEKGELSASNLAFKFLRNQNYIGRLNEMKNEIYDRILSWNP